MGPQPLYKRWWLWTAVGGGLVLIAAVTGGVLAYRAAHPSLSEPIHEFKF